MPDELLLNQYLSGQWKLNKWKVWKCSPWRTVKQRNYLRHRMCQGSYLSTRLKMISKSREEKHCSWGKGGWPELSAARMGKHCSRRAFQAVGLMRTLENLNIENWKKRLLLMRITYGTWDQLFCHSSSSHRSIEILTTVTVGTVLLLFGTTVNFGVPYMLPSTQYFLFPDLFFFITIYLLWVRIEI